MASLLLLLALPLLAIGLLAAGERWRYLALFTSVIVFQNLATMILLKSGAIGIREGILLLYIKEVILALGLGFEFLRMVAAGRISVDRTDLLSFGYLGWCAFHFAALSGDIPLGFRVAGFRSLTILPCVYLLGRWILMRRAESLSERFGKRYLAFAIAVAAVSVVEFFIIPETAWLAIGQPEYYQMKLGYLAEEGEIYGNMYASFGIFFVRRAASIIADPIMSTYFTVYGLLLVGLIRPLARGRWLLLAAGSLFSMGRSAILTYLASVVELFLDRRRIIPFGSLSVTCFLGLLCIPLLPIEPETMNTFLGSHYRGLVDAMGSVRETPLGLGVGGASNLVAALLSALGKESEVTVGDTYVGSLIVQVGIPGLLLFLAFNASLAAKLLAMSKRAIPGLLPDASFYRATAGFILGVTALSVINETGYGLTSSGLAFLLAGLLSTEFYARSAAAGRMPA